MEEERARRRIGDEAEASTDKTGKRLRSAERTVNDEDVEEFFTILKRLQEVKRLKSSHPSGNETKQCKTLWQPVFTLDDFKEIKVGRRDRKERANEPDEVEVVSRSFDLNAEPEVESPRC